VVQACKLRIFDVFAGVGVMSLGIESAMNGMKTTHAIKLVPSAVRTLRCASPLPKLLLKLCIFRISFHLLRRNSPGMIMYNQYAIKPHRGLLMDESL
jgi:site-specific DNA-cytosine methylase